MKKPLLFLAAGLALTFAACNKDKDNNSGNATASIVGNWTYEKATYWETENGITTSYTNTIDSLEPCERDNSITFRADGTGTTNRGANPCSWDSAAKNNSFTYSLASDKSALYLSGSGETDTLPLKSLTNAAFVLQYNSQAVDDTFRAEVTYKRLP